MTKHLHTNALVHETSPYLLQHAHNSVQWYAWGEQAFAKARQLQRPIFLSIGYSTCYWCHVMERQCFEVEAIAAIQNEHFVNIKVDREERPDVDDLYMTATQLMTRQGGWPMSVFLTPPGARGDDDPGLQPLYCGTYFPPEPMHGRPSFPQVLEGVAEAWRDRREQVLEQAEKITAAVGQALEQQTAPGPVDASVVQQVANQLLRRFDPEHGGFGRAPKFPQPANLALLLHIQRNNPHEPLRQAIALTLDRMARGGVYDQVGGGFHRYSVDEQWLVPHFEKMLYDNGQLLSLYADALELTGDQAQQEQWRRVLRETGDYLLREMTDDSGAFWSAQDAEVDGKEGGNYVWTADEVRAAIDDAELAAVALNLYGLDTGPNFQDPHHPDATPVNVLHLPRPLHDLEDDVPPKRQRINAQLKAVRDERKQPGTDDKVLVAWNGMAIAGLARAGQVLGEARFLEAAARAADAIMHHMVAPEGGLYRTMRCGEVKIDAFLEDYAFFAGGLMALHRAGVGGGRYHHAARRVVDQAIDRFAMAGGGYYDTLADQRDLLVRKRSLYDGAVPSGNSQMVHVLIDLVEADGESRWTDRAIADLRRASEDLREQGLGLPHMARALLRLLETGDAKVRDRLAALPEQAPASDAAQPVSARVDPPQVTLSTGRATFRVILEVAEGFHVTADHLALTLEGAQGVELQVRYPEPEAADFAFADEPLAVHRGEVAIDATLSADAAFDVRQAQLWLNVQVCDASTCRAPQRIELSLVIQ